MKKTILFVSAIVALAMGTMLSSCNKDNKEKEIVPPAGKGCYCSFYDAGTFAYTEYIYFDEFVVYDCTSLAALLSEEEDIIVKCASTK